MVMLKEKHSPICEATEVLLRNPEGFADYFYHLYYYVYVVKRDVLGE